MIMRHWPFILHKSTCAIDASDLAVVCLVANGWTRIETLAASSADLLGGARGVKQTPRALDMAWRCIMAGAGLPSVYHSQWTDSGKAIS
jgi:hypothetical protein